MAIKTINPIAPEWYTPRSEEGADCPARFRIRGLNGSEMGYVMPELIVDEANQLVTGATGKGLDMILRYGLKDWEHVEGEGGGVAYAPSNFALLPHEVRVELALQIIVRSFVSPAEKKT